MTAYRAQPCTVPTPNPLEELTGSPRVRWSVTDEDDTLTLHCLNGTPLCLSLPDKDVQALRQLVGRTDNLTLEIILNGTPTVLFMTGQQVGERAWAGQAALASDIDSIVKMLEENIAFAEQFLKSIRWWSSLTGMAV
jgi:hypothetical protein